jgi:hypothetical protein
VRNENEDNPKPMRKLAELNHPLKDILRLALADPPRRIVFVERIEREEADTMPRPVPNKVLVPLDGARLVGMALRPADARLHVGQALGS